MKLSIVLLLTTLSVVAAKPSDFKCKLLSQLQNTLQETQSMCELCTYQCFLSKNDMTDEEGFPVVDKVVDLLYAEDQFPKSRSEMNRLGNVCVRRAKKIAQPTEPCNGYGHLQMCFAINMPKLCPGNEPCLDPPYNLTSDKEKILEECSQCSSLCSLEQMKALDENKKIKLARMVARQMKPCLEEVQDIEPGCEYANTFVSCLENEFALCNDDSTETPESSE